MKILSPHVVKLLSLCPLCGKDNGGVDASCLGESGATQVVYVRGKRCAHSLLAVVLTQGELVSSVGFVTDLSEADVMHAARRRAIAVDDVLATHAWLKEPANIWQNLLS